jgi:hypothetical protein
MSSEIATDIPHGAAGFDVGPDVVDRSDVVDIAEQLERGARERNRAGARHLSME